MVLKATQLDLIITNLSKLHTLSKLLCILICVNNFNRIKFLDLSVFTLPEMRLATYHWFLEHVDDSEDKLFKSLYDFLRLIQLRRRSQGVTTGLQNYEQGQHLPLLIIKHRASSNPPLPPYRYIMRCSEPVCCYQCW
jgi:hypothetical protein